MFDFSIVYKNLFFIAELDRYVLHFLWVGAIIVGGEKHIFLIGVIIKKIYIF